MWYGKAPGVDRTGDLFRHANFAGVGPHGGVLAIAGDDPMAKSSTFPTASEACFADLMMPVLFPGNVQEVLDLGRLGFELSRYSGCWVAFKIVTNVSDEIGTAEVSPDRIRVVDPGLTVDGRPWRATHGMIRFPPWGLEMERELFHGRMEAAKAFAAANGVNRISVPASDAWLGIAAAGKTYYDVREALRALGLDDAALAHARHPAAPARHDVPARARHHPGVRAGPRGAARHRGEAELRRAHDARHPLRADRCGRA